MEIRRLLVGVLCVLVAVFFLAACGGGGTFTPDPGTGGDGANNGNGNDNTAVWTGTAATSAIDDPGITGIPEVPFDYSQTSHAVSNGDSTFELYGDEYLQQYHGTEDGRDLHIVAPANPGEGEFAAAWGLYKFSGLNGYTPKWLNIECLPDVFGQEYFVAIADYTAGDWRWFGPVTFPEFQLDMSDLNHHVVSALGNMYFIVVCRDGSGAVISKSTLTLEEGGGDDKGWLPGAPHHLVATDGVYADKVVVEWDPGIGADYYNLWRKAPEGEWGKYAEVSDIRFEDHETEFGVHYLYKAFSVNSEGTSEHSNIDEGWAGEGGGGTGPGTPYDLVATDGEFEDHVLLTWEYDGDYGVFEIWRQSPNGSWESYAETTEFAFEDFDVTYGDYYHYKVWAWLNEERGDHSNIDVGWAGEGAEIPGTPYDFVATDGEFDEKVVLTWEFDGDYDAFEIWRKAPEGDWESYAETQDLTYEDTEVEPGVVYTYKVWAWLGDYRGDHSNHDEGWAGERVEGPGAPFDLVASDGEFAEKVLLTWEYDGECDIFEIWRKAPDGEWGSYAETPEYAFEDTAVEQGIHYHYKVCAWIGEQHGEFSNIDEGWAGEGGGLTAPYGLTASKGEYLEYIGVCWEMDGDYDYFQLWRKVDGIEGWDMIFEPEGTCYDDFNVEAGVTYIYKVIALLGEQASDPSNTDHGYLGEGGSSDGQIDVLVQDGESGPLSGIGVVLYGNEEIIDASTGEDGHAVFDGLELGLYLVVPVAGDLVFEPACQLVELSAEEAIALVDFTASLSSAPLHRLRGVAYTFTGDPIEGSRWAPLANVRMRITLIGLETSWDVFTDENGYYEMVDLPEGSYSIIPLLEGFTFSPELHDPVVNGETAPGLQNFRAYPAG